MKHLPIGKIKEFEKKGKVRYDVSLFRNNVHKSFDNRSDALELLQFHAEEFLKLGDTNAICVKYYNSKRKMHYIMIDTNLTENDKPEVHEETRFEYMQSHSLYFKDSASRRVINERQITSSDVLRSTINFSPWYSFMYIMLVLLMVAFSVVYIVEAVNYLDENYLVGVKHVLMPNKAIDLWLSLGLFIITLLSAGYTIASIYVSRKKILACDGDNSKIDWHKWYKIRLWTIVIFTLLSAAALGDLIIFTSDHIRDFSSLSPLPGFKDKIYLLVSVYCLYVLFGFAFVSTLFTFVYILLHKFLVLRSYFTKEQRREFRRWLRHKNENEVSASVSDDFYIFDPFISEYAVLKEIQFSQAFRIRYTNDEYNDYKQKAIHHFKESMKIYIDDLKENKNEYIPKDNQ